MPEHTLNPQGTCKHGSYGKCWICDEIIELKKDKAYFEEGFQIAINRVNALKSVLLEAIYAVRGNGHESHIGNSIVYIPQINVEMVKDWEKVLQAPKEGEPIDEGGQENVSNKCVVAERKTNDEANLESRTGIKNQDHGALKNLG